MILPIFALYAALRIYPIAQAFYLSLTDYQIGIRKFNFVGLANYRELLSNLDFLVSLKNSLSFAALTLVFTLFIALVIALVMSRASIAGIGFLQTLIFLPVVVSVVPSAIIWNWIYDPQYGILNYLLSLVGASPVNWLFNKSTALYAVIAFTVWRWIGYYMIIFWVGIRAIPETYLEAAKIDGASAWKIGARHRAPAAAPHRAAGDGPGHDQRFHDLHRGVRDDHRVAVGARQHAERAHLRHLPARAGVLPDR